MISLSVEPFEVTAAGVTELHRALIETQRECNAIEPCVSNGAARIALDTLGGIQYAL